VSPVDSALLVGVGSDERRASPSTGTSDDPGSDFGNTLQKVTKAPTTKSPSSSPPPSAAPASSSTPATPVPAGVAGSVPASVVSQTSNQTADPADGGSTTAKPSDLPAAQGDTSDIASSTAGQITAGQVTAGQVTAGQITAGQITAGQITDGTPGAEPQTPPSDEKSSSDGSQTARLTGAVAPPTGSPAGGTNEVAVMAATARTTAPATSAGTGPLQSGPLQPGAQSASESGPDAAPSSPTPLPSVTDDRSPAPTASAIHANVAPASSSPPDPSGSATPAAPATTSATPVSAPTVATPAPSTVPTPPTPTVTPPAPTPAPPTPAQQVVTILAPLRSSDDGTHEVTIGLEPEGLGTVKATVTVSTGQIVVQLGTDNDQARDALRQALPLLKSELGGDGTSANVLLSNGGQHDGRTLDRDLSSSDGATDADDMEGDPPAVTSATPAPSGHGHIDLHL
jgi:flagellar hook-length control protein FliK